MSGRRTERLANQIREELARMIGSLKDASGNSVRVFGLEAKGTIRATF